jgi:hypothetical protein
MLKILIPTVQRLVYADNVIILDSEGHIADEGTTSEVIATAKEMAFSPPAKKSGQSSENTEEDLTRILSAEEAPTGQDRRTGDTAVYKYYIQTVHPLSAAIFLLACSVFVVGLTLPREYNTSPLKPSS